MKYLKTSSLIILSIVFANCSSVKTVTVSTDFTNYEVVEIPNTGTQGTVLLKVYSYGYTVEKAIERAKMDAVHAVLFKGIPNSNMSRPMIKNGQSSKKQYFDNFFGLYKVTVKNRKPIDILDISKTFNAPYKLYVQLSSDGSISPKDRFKVGKLYKVGVVVSVNINELRRQMEKDGIIQSLNSIF